MNRIKTKKWYVLAIVLATSAFMVAFGIAMAATVQWSREQPATVSSVAADILPSDSITIFQDVELTDELAQGEVLEFPTLISFQPPLTGFVEGNTTSINLWLRNDSEIPLAVLRICCPGIFDPVTDERLTSYSVDPILPCCAPASPIQTGEVQQIQVRVFQPKQNFENTSFTVIIGAIGEVTDDGAGVTNISPQLQRVLESSAAQGPEQ